MNAEEVRDYCLSLKNTTESFPFDDVSLVFKVENKMYLLISLDAADINIAVKCDPDQTEFLRDHYSAVEPAYHFNKKHWNNIYLDRDMSDDEIRKWIDHSYMEVVRKLPKKIRMQYTPPLFHFSEVDSTNKTIKKIYENVEHPSGSIVIADFQTAGRGQAGNSWESEAGKNLTFSIFFKPSCIPSNMAFVISEMISLCVKRTLDKYIPDVTVKWPNDIYFKDKKLAGILIENSIQQGKISQSIAGIGININQTKFLGNAPNPVSMTLITGQTYDIASILEDFRQIFAEKSELINKRGDINSNDFISPDNPDIICEAGNPYFETIHKEYINSAYRKEGFHKYRDDTGIFDAAIYDIEPAGYLILKRTDGSLSRYAFKEISFVMD